LPRQGSAVGGLRILTMLRPLRP